jgi:hypothetical protein
MAMDAASGSRMDVNLLDQADTGMQRNSFQIPLFNAKYDL